MSSPYDRLADAVRACSACPIGLRGTRGGGVPGMWSDSKPDASRDRRVLVLGEAPGGVEMIQGKPFVGQAGELLKSLFDEVGLTSYYISNIAKCRPPVVGGKQQAPDKITTAACAPFLRAEFELVKPTHLILLGKTAAKLVVDGNFGMKDVVNTTIGTIGPKYRVGTTLILYHPSYFLRSRTAPWIQKAIREWKQAIKLFFGAEVPNYQVERVRCETHDDPHHACPSAAMCGQYGDEPCLAQNP